MAQSTLNLVLLSADVQEAQEARTDPRSGEVYDARPAGGTLHVLDSDNGVPVITKIKCSVAAARRYQSENSFRIGEPLRLTTLLIDLREYKLDNGKQGLTRSLVEDGTSAAKPRGTFSLQPARPAQPGAAQTINNGQRQPVTA